ncbi:MAG: RagB/SusD family nutrient uptake outer membrane protein [Tannerellaceae bacterium]|jgi:tetratricopeptide (TPR) repeat protein|nr:RagB/SusD family nutrient uptake outer membrane protein [Tannerellaceae bacterium]
MKTIHTILTTLSFILSAILSVILLPSCEDFLDLSPSNSIPSDRAITDAGTLRAAVVGAYSQLQDYYSGSYVSLGVMPADFVSYNGTLSQYLQLDQNAIPNDNVITVGVYRTIYRAINSANSIIASVASIDDPLLTQAEKDNILGEAYFIRALAYFDLARGWGGVQIQLKPTETLDVLKGIQRSSQAGTYDQVAADLAEAERLLTDDASTRNRAQKATALALRARLHLYREQWDEAERYATQVINNPKYALVEPYEAFFTAPFLTEESVFELTFSLNDRNSYWNMWFPASLGGQYTLKPSDKAVERLSDPDTGGSRNAAIAGTGSNVYGRLYNTAGQAIDPAYVIRIAELYLIRAEARAKKASPDLAGATEDINKVRARAGVPPLTGVTGAPALIFAIEEENGVEFAFEAHRWFDLVRTRRAGEVLGITNTDFWLFPLPSSDILSDPDVTQNPGY